MKTFLTKFPWFYFLIGIYPLLFLWANNRTEVDPAGVLCPMLYTLLGLLVLFAILSLALRNVFKAALLGSLTLVLFLSYGRVYYWLRDIFRDAFVSRHRFLVLVFVMFFALGAWGVIKGASRIMKIQSVINLGDGQPGVATALTESAQSRADAPQVGPAPSDWCAKPSATAHWNEP